MLALPSAQSGCARRSRPRPRGPRFPLLAGGFVLGAEWPAVRSSQRGRPLLRGRISTLFPGRLPGTMASRGRKRKAEAAVVAAAEKQEKLAGGQKEVEEATVVIEHW